jgi:hypothetical protein
MDAPNSWENTFSSTVRPGTRLNSQASVDGFYPASRRTVVSKTGDSIRAGQLLPGPL